MNKMKKSDIFEYLYTQRYKKGIVPTLDRLLQIYNLEDLNIDSNKIIHIAGTNGKGSTSSFLKSILESADKRVAVFTSPHIKDIEERFYMTNVDDNLNNFIEKDRLTDILFAIKERVDSYQNKHPYHFITFFEYMTLAFFIWCSEENPDYIILEVGMGGRFDATNIVDAKYGAITSISLDHTSYLGDRLEDIAFEKAGIIKNNQITVLGDIQKNALDVIEKIALKKSKKLIKITDKTYLFNFNNPMLKASYQISNLKVAISLAKNILPQISQKSIQNGIDIAHWPARFEEISQNPTILRDVAHNIEGMKLLKESISQNYKNRSIITIFTVMRDKDYINMLKIIDSISSFIVFTKPIERAEDPIILQKLSQTKSLVIENPKEAFKKVKEIVKEYDNGMILATGSIFLMEHISF